MSFDINKPFTLRNGKEVLWWHEVHSGFVYGYEDDDGNVRAIWVDANGLCKSSLEQGFDLINILDYDWASLYLITETSEFDYQIGGWHHSKRKADRWSNGSRLAYVRRLKGTSTVEILPLDTEVE